MEFKKVDVTTYVNAGIESGVLSPFKAQKFARIIARQGSVGETVVSWSVDSLGNEIEEKVGQVKLDEKTKNPGWIATKVDENGNIIVDNNNHPNQWIIDDSTFRKKYEVDPENPTLFRPSNAIQTFVQIPDNIILNQWGSDMKIASGGYINITKSDDMYGISERDFNDTYKAVDSLTNNGPRL